MLSGARVVLVGSMSPLGMEIAARLAGYGAAVVGIDHRSGPTSTALRAHVVADASDQHEAERGIDAAVTALGGIDALVLGAAAQHRGRSWETDESTWRSVMAGTLDTSFFALRYGLRLLTSGGSVVAISSVNADLAHPGMAAYAAAKGAVNALVRQAALDCAPRGIRVNAVAPGLVDAPDEQAMGYPMGRTVTSREVADAIAFLASSLASGITGVVVPVDGGLSITSPVAVVRPSAVAELSEGARQFDTGGA